MKVYIVTSGEYSDYQIDAVFTDKQLADRYVSVRGGGVEEWVADEWRQAGFYPFRVEFYNDGEGYAEFDNLDSLDRAKKRAFHWFRGITFDTLIVWVEAATMEAAKKIAAERRAMLLKDGEFDEDRFGYFSDDGIVFTKSLQ